ncbi:unnamed protein product [Protopolystoma xenopodis]|uniref:Uncharacterized protein n=1 Tax=Protopolystoma xenopodis TaxID=117903 RepID=A0A3S5B874_9PLAT|nr:unnamed protein product [Protopolystoma xenopodis]
MAVLALSMHSFALHPSSRGTSFVGLIVQGQCDSLQLVNRMFSASTSTASASGTRNLHAVSLPLFIRIGEISPSISMSIYASNLLSTPNLAPTCAYSRGARVGQELHARAAPSDVGLFRPLAQTHSNMGSHSAPFRMPPVVSCPTARHRFLEEIPNRVIFRLSRLDSSGSVVCQHSSDIRRPSSRLQFHEPHK